MDYDDPRFEDINELTRKTMEFNGIQYTLDNRKAVRVELAVRLLYEVRLLEIFFTEARHPIYLGDEYVTDLCSSFKSMLLFYLPEGKQVIDKIQKWPEKWLKIYEDEINWCCTVIETIKGSLRLIAQEEIERKSVCILEFFDKYLQHDKEQPENMTDDIDDVEVANIELPKADTTKQFDKKSIIQEYVKEDMKFSIKWVMDAYEDKSEEKIVQIASAFILSDSTKQPDFGIGLFPEASAYRRLSDIGEEYVNAKEEDDKKIARFCFRFLAELEILSREYAFAEEERFSSYIYKVIESNNEDKS